MLSLSRRPGERIVIGDNIEVQVLEVRGGRVRLGIVAPRSVSVHRGELVDHAAADNRDAAARGTQLPPPSGDAIAISFPQGLYGLAEHRRFAVYDVPDSATKQLVSLDDPNVVLTISDAQEIDPEYPVDAACAAAGVSLDDAVVGLVLVTPRHGAVRVNLRAPIVVDVAKREGRQVLLDDPSLPLVRVIGEPAVFAGVVIG